LLKLVFAIKVSRRARSRASSPSHLDFSSCVMKLAVAAALGGFVALPLAAEGGVPSMAAQRPVGITLKDSPDTPGWLVERLYHAHAIVCPWQRPGDAPDADCLARDRRIKKLRDAISTCRSPLRRNNRSLGHRGAPLVAPEETVASWEIGAASGAGWLECDASITGSMDFVCRHGTCDLAFTTDIVTNHPELHKKCTKPWTPGSGEPAVCCTYDFTLEELSNLCATMESKQNASATSVDEYILGPPGFRSGAIAKSQCHKLVPFTDYLRLMKDNGYSAIPELKDTMEKGLVAFLHRHGKDIFWLAEKFADELMASFGPEQGIAQTFDHVVAAHWKQARPSMSVEYMWTGPPPSGQNCSIKNGKPDRADCGGPALLRYLAGLGVNMFSPPIQALVTNGTGHTIIPSSTAALLKDLNVQSIGSWSLERQGCSTLDNGKVAMTPEIQEAELAPCGYGGGYYGSVEASATFQHEDVLDVVDVLFKQVGISKLFADFPATVAAYANCVLDAEPSPPAGAAASPPRVLLV